MSTSDQFQSLLRAINPAYKLVSSEELTGGIAATTTALSINHGGDLFRLVVREYGERQRSFSPNVANEEHQLLAALADHHIPVPNPVFVDPKAEFTAEPCMVMDFIEGSAGFGNMSLDHAIPRFAKVLADIHRLNLNELNVDFLPLQILHCEEKISTVSENPDESLEELRVRAAIAKLWPINQKNANAFLHGDYWPNNTMWKDGELIAVIDWEDAAIGDPLHDLANVRMEMIMYISREAMDMFTEAYKKEMPHLNYTNLPFWDLYLALKPMHRVGVWAEGDEELEKKMRAGHEEFRSQAMLMIK